jgi:hypothetical protein
MEPLMHRTLTVAAIAVLVFAGIAKLVAAPSRTAAGTDTSTQPTISTYDLHTGYRGMNTLPVTEIPALAGYGISGQSAVLHNGRCSAAV